MSDPSNPPLAEDASLGTAGEDPPVDINPNVEPFDPPEDEIWRPIPVLLVFVTLVTIGGAMLLTSPPGPRTEEATAWQSGSLLKPICDLLAMNYNHGTAEGMAIKSLLRGLGAAVALLITGLGWVFIKETDAAEPSPGPIFSGAGPERMPPILGAQLLMLLALAWSLLATQWSNAPIYAFGAAVLFVVGIMWAFGLGIGLGKRGALVVIRGLVWVSTMVAALAIWYHFERRPDRPTGYPIGPPHVLAACLTPALVIVWSVWWSTIGSLSRSTLKGDLISLLRLTGAGTVLGWAIYLSGSATGFLGLAVGGAILVYHSLRQAWRVFVLAGLLLIIAAGGSWMMFSGPGRAGIDGAANRGQLYAWQYAAQIIKLRPVSGIGPGGYELVANNLVSGDIAGDPEAFGFGLLGHARNEWLETMCELGGSGLAMVVGGLGLTILGAVQVSRRQRDPNLRALVVGAAAGLTAMMAETGLSDSARHAAHPIVFFTLVGAIWASGKEEGLSRLGRWKEKGWVRGTVLIGIVALSLGQAYLNTMDWNAARAQSDIEDRRRAYAFDQALSMTQQASAYRLDPRHRLDAHFATIRLCSTWAEWALQNGQRRSASAFGQPPSGKGRQDFETAIRVADLGLEEVLRLEGACPSYVGIGWEWCNLAEVREQASNALTPETGPPAYPPRAHAALIREHHRNPFTPAVARRLCLLPPTENQPLSEQLTIIAPCLRAGTLDDGLQDAIRQLSLRDGFDAQFTPLLKSVDRVNPNQPPASWTPAFAPEIQWIAAIVLQQQTHYAQAADLLRRSLHWGDALSEMYPYRRSAMESHLSAILFLADPENDQEALALAEAALRHLPAKPSRFVPEDRILTLLVGLDLARGDESSARERLQTQSGPAQDVRMMNQHLGGGYLQLAQELTRPGADAKRLNLARGWLVRAAELAPKNTEIHHLAGMLAIEAGDADGVTAALSALMSSAADARIVNQLAAQAQARFPNHQPLAQWIADHSNAHSAPPPATLPGH